MTHVNSHQEMATNWPAVANDAADSVAKFAAHNAYTEKWKWVRRERKDNTPKGAVTLVLPSGFLPNKTRPRNRQPPRFVRIGSLPS